MLRVRLEAGIEHVFHARVLLQLAYLCRAMGNPVESMRYLNGAVHVWRNADPDHVLANQAKALLADWEGRG